MGLRINTNVAALNTSRILRHNTSQLNKSLERLSSGLRINRAADDAAAARARSRPVGIGQLRCELLQPRTPRSSV